MADCFITRRGGGGSVRTPIITITSETELPADPKPGTIAILTTTPIGRIYAQTSTPESPSVGDLWFSPSAVANVVYIDGKEAYAVKTVRQYNGTAWETVNAFQYTDGAWSTMVYLLNGIDECKPVTGGWKAIAIRRDSSWTESEKLAPTITKVDGGIILTQSASGYKSGAYHTSQKIDVSGYDVLRIQGEMTIKNKGEVRLVSAVGPYSESNTVLYEELPSSGAIDITMDVSGLTGDYYVLFDIACDSSKSTIFTLTKIWLYKVWYLFDNGDQYEAVTGGWYQYSREGYNGTANIGEVISLNAPLGTTAAATMRNKIDLSGYKSVEIYVSSFYSGVNIIVAETNSGYVQDNYVVNKSCKAKGWHSADVSSLSGEYYIYVTCGNDASATVDQVRLA